jgi:hypothetical protein
MLKPGREQVWTLVATAAAIAGAVATRGALKSAWRTVRHEEPPENPADPATAWHEAILWTSALAVGAGLGRLFMKRLATSGWRRATGELPPGLQRGA